jgi:DNA-binding MarR family transcriptional regulator
VSAACDIADHDISPTAKLVYCALREAEGPLSRKAIEERIGEDKYAVLGAVKQLRKAGLITRTRDVSDLRTAVYQPA